MENRRKRSISGEIFSFPSTPNQDQDSDFEFGCFTQDLPNCQDSYRTSPADHLFFNGRLLPHSFPLQPATIVAAAADHGGTYSPGTTTSRTSSINSKDSLMSSRSNSTNSRSSTCSSARTSSSSDSLERRLLYYKHSRIHNKASKLVTAQLYGESQRWQHMNITAVPVLKREVSSRRNKNNGVTVKEAMKAKKKGQTNGRERTGNCLKFFQLFLFVCRQCHAMEPSRKPDAVKGKLSFG